MLLDCEAPLKSANTEKEVVVVEVFAVARSMRSVQSDSLLKEAEA